MTQTISWPPQYRIKKHRLAKHVKLKAMTDHCLEITTPLRFNQKKIPHILEENKKWIIEHLAKLPEKKPDELPTQIIFHSLLQTWPVHYIASDSRFEMIMRPSQEIVFVGKPKEISVYKKQLIAWIKIQARDYLLQELSHLSFVTKMNFDSLTIRDQKTLWGSCTINKSISLNYKLIFLPKSLLQYVIIHELCHTIHLNHSTEFWNKVAEFDPDWHQHRRELRRADQYVPAWI